MAGVLIGQIMKPYIVDCYGQFVIGVSKHHYSCTTIYYCLLGDLLMGIRISVKLYTLCSTHKHTLFTPMYTRAYQSNIETYYGLSAHRIGTMF